MNHLQYLLTKLDEECKEVGIICSKTIQFGYNSNNNGQLEFTNKELLHKEINDVLAIIDLLNEECNLGFAYDIEAIKAKKEKVKQYKSISAGLGYVEP